VILSGLHAVKVRYELVRSGERFNPGNIPEGSNKTHRKRAHKARTVLLDLLKQHPDHEQAQKMIEEPST
jgi:hypothetical protein